MCFKSPTCKTQTERDETVRVAGNYNAAFLAVGLGWIVFAWPWLSGEVTIPYDAKAHFQPQLQFLANALHSGQSPFWTPNVFGGSPQIADPQSLIFSPAILLAWLDASPSFRELDLFCFALLGLAAFSVLMFFKDRGWHPAGAVVAALATAFGGSAIWRIQHIKQIEAFAFSMLCLWLLSRALDRKSLFYGLLAGGAGCFMVIEPGQIAMLACYVLAAYVINHWVSAPHFWTSVKESLKPLLAGGVAASIFAAGPILLSFLFIQASNRPDIPFKEAARGALHPASLLTAVVPDLFAAHSSAPYWGPASSGWRANWLAMSENMGQVYIGALPILLIVAIGFLRGRIWSREIRFFTLAMSALLLYALGRYTRVFHLFYDYLPGVDLFRRPADATYALGAMAAIISGYLLHRVLTGNEAPTPRQRIAAAAIFGSLFVLCAGVAAAHNHLTWAAQPMLLSVGIFTGGWLTLFFAKEYASRYTNLTVAALAAFMTADLAINNGPNRSTAKPPEDYDALRVDTRNETIAYLKDHLKQAETSTRRDRVELVGLGFEWPNISLIHNLDHVLGYNPVRLGEVVQAMGAEETIAEARQRKFTPLFPSYHSKMANFLGLRYIAINQPIERIDKWIKPGDLTLLANTHDAYIYENPGALPRVTFASNWKPANFERMINDGEWPDFDPKTTVLLRGEAKAGESRTESIAVGEAKIGVQYYRNTEVQVSVDAPKAGFVVLNDVWHPWWFGTVDGKPADIFRANVLFRAIRVPPGKHIVRFEFKPVAGAIHEIMAHLKAKSLEPIITPADEMTTSEASARDLWKSAGEAPETLR